MAEKDEKLNRIIESLKEIAAGQIHNGIFMVEFRVHEDQIIGAVERPKDREIKLG